MDELRSIHLGLPMKGSSVLAKLQAAFEKAMADEVDKNPRKAKALVQKARIKD